MNSQQSNSSSFKHRVKNFSDSMFRNYLIMKKRWEISACEKKRAAEISRLGNSVYRLAKQNELDTAKLTVQIEKITGIDKEIKALEEKLRDIIMKADLQRQLTAGAVKKTPETMNPKAPEAVKPEAKPSVKSAAKPEVKPAVKQPVQSEPAMKTVPKVESKAKSGVDKRTADDKKPKTLREPVAQKQSITPKVIPGEKPVTAKKPAPTKKADVKTPSVGETETNKPVAKAPEKK